MKRFHAESGTPTGFITRVFLLLPPAFLIALKYDIPHILILTGILLLLPVFRKKPVSFGKGVLLFYIPLSVLLALVPSYMFEVDPGRIMPGDVLLRSHIFVPLLLYASAFACGLRRSREITAFIALMALFTTLICGDLSMAKTLFNTRFMFTDTLLHLYRYTYIACAGLQAFGILLLLTSDARIDSVSPVSERKLTARIRYFLLLLIPCFLIWEMKTYYTHESDARQLERFLLMKMRRRSDTRRSFASHEVRVAGSFRRDGEMPTGEILLRVRSKQVPGYLRGRVYDVYEPGGIWRVSSSAKEETELLDTSADKELALSYYPFRMDKIVPDEHSLEIFFSRNFITDYFPVPGNASGVEMVSEKAGLSPDGVLFAKKTSRSAGYIVHVPSYEYASAYPDPRSLSETELQRLCSLPRSPVSHSVFILRNAILSGEIMPDSRRIMELITGFLKNNYLYSLDPQDKPRFMLRKWNNAPPPKDPVERFLIHTGAGHCELFASSAVLLLRSAGVPARYVTGFVCQDWHPAGFYYATDRDAHAWVEAYDRENKRWIMLDPTPVSWQAELKNPQLNDWDSFQAKAGMFFENLMASIVRGYAGKYISIGLRTVGNGCLFLLTDPRGIVLLLLIISGTVMLVIRIRRLRDPYRYYPPAMRQCVRIMQNLEKRLARRTGIRRMPDQPWLVWADEFKNDPIYPELKKLTELYESQRYRIAGPDDESLRKLTQLSTQLIRKNKTGKNSQPRRSE